MDSKFTLVSDSKEVCEPDFNVNNTLLVNFARDIKTDEYCFSFENNNFSSLSFTFISNLAIDCYFVYLYKSSKPKFTGYHNLQTEEFKVDIKDCEKFFIFIPRNKNRDVCTALTLVSMFSE